MWEIFKRASDKQPSEAERALKDWGIKYKKQSDGSLLVPGNLNISSRSLAKLPDLSSVKVGGGFYCSDNQLTSLEHAPQTVGEDFDCSNNQLTSLEYVPQTVGGNFFCNYNQLTSLEQAPQQFKTLYSDFGEFASWDAVPQQLRLSPATRARQAKERERQENERQIAFEEGATVLNAPIKVSSPLRLKK